MLRNMIGLLLALLILAACGNTGTGTDSAQTGATAEATSAATSATDTAGGQAAEVQTVTGESYPNTLTIMSHDSFNLSTEVIAEFEKANNVKLQFLKAGDTGSALNRALLTKSNPLADVFFGVDNTFLSRALNADAFEPYAPQGLDQIPTDLKLDAQNRLIPIDYGFVNLNYDRSSELFKDIPEPEQLRLEDLTKPEFKGKVVVENPATSSPGLAFMLATIDYFGQENWLDWWQQMKANDLVVVDGWETAYYTNFSGSSGKGPQPIVVSYATTPAAEVAFSDQALSEPPTGNILPPKAAFRQIEFAGILKGTKNRALAEKWMDYMLSERVQNDIMPQMVVYPALPTATIPEVYQKFAPVPESPSVLDPETIAANRDAWIREWTQAVLR
ncbi:MAG TPA: thiamine ABC transporter substrate-binding protein [Herpetosiphonaceae bacterium]